MYKERGNRKAIPETLRHSDTRNSSLCLHLAFASLLLFSSDKECRSVLDIAFIIDSSGSIGTSNWQRMKRFLKALVSKLDVSNSGTHIAAVSYSNNPKVVMRFSNFQGVDQVNRLFDEMRWQRGFTYTDKALLLADSDIFQTSNGMRPDVPKVSQSLISHDQRT